VQYGIEKRAYPRIEMRVPIKYRLIASLNDLDFDPVVEEIFERNTINMSAGGACIHTDEALEPDSILLIMFEVPGMRTPMKTVARVIWCREEGAAGFHVGLQYISMTEEQIDRLKERLSAGGAW